MGSDSFKNLIYKMCLEMIYLIYVYKEDLALNDLQWLKCHKTRPIKTPLFGRHYPSPEDIIDVFSAYYGSWNV